MIDSHKNKVSFGYINKHLYVTFHHITQVQTKSTLDLNLEIDYSVQTQAYI